MHPAPSIVIFTTLSGAGYGLLFLLGLGSAGGLLPDSPWFGGVSVGLALLLVTAGLVSSTFHLGHPERAWRALSQWRSSWLSREGIAAIITYAPALLFALGWIVFASLDGPWRIAGLITGVMALVTVACTGMIYASLRAIPRWTDATVVPVYLAFSLSSGGALLVTVLAILGPLDSQWAWLVALATALAWVLKFFYWHRIDNAAPVATAESATGLGHLGTVRQLEAPHSGENYIMREMGFQIARKHVARLRKVALLLGGVIPVLAFLIAGFVGGPVLVIAALVGLAGTAMGVLLERWLFFAEAQHAAMLFYGAKTV